MAIFIGPMLIQIKYSDLLLMDQEQLSWQMHLMKMLVRKKSYKSMLLWLKDIAGLIKMCRA